MALTLGVSSASAFTPVTSTSMIKVEPSSTTSPSSMPPSSFLPLPPSGLQLPTPSPTTSSPNFRSLAEVAYLEYAMYLLLNQHNNALLAAAAAAATVNTGLAKPTPLQPFHPQHLPSPLIHLNNSPMKPLSVPEIITPNRDSPLSSSKPPTLLPVELDYLHNSISKNKLGRSYNPGRPLAMADRARILELYEKGHKISHIARIIGVTHSCVSKIMTRYRRTGSMHPRSAQQSKKHSLASSSISVASSSFSSGQSSASLSPSHHSSMSLNSYDSSSSSSSSSSSESSSSNSLLTPNGLLPRSDGELQISPSLFFPKPVPLALLQKC